MEDKFLQVKRLIEKANKVLCISHKRPDGDTLGAAVAVSHGLKQFNKTVDMACVDPVPERFSFLPGINRMINSFDFRTYDLIIVLDSGASYMTDFHEIYPDIWSGDVPVVNIDHHSSNDNFGLCNIVDDSAASTTVILCRLFDFLGIIITPVIATALLTGIYNDTGSFMHANTSVEVMEVSAKLLEAGGKFTSVSKNLFRTTPFSTLKLWGRVLENARINDEGVTISVITWRDFEDCDASSDEISGVVDFMNSIPGSKYTCLLNEDKNGYIKGSFRTQRNDIDLTELAARFGGGGHKKAAGFTMQGRLQKEVHWKIVTQETNRLDVSAENIEKMKLLQN
jgi:phosphoesterase RecJ-like protein